MKNKKALLPAVMAGVMGITAFGFAGCGGGNVEKTNPDAFEVQIMRAVTVPRCGSMSSICLKRIIPMSK